MKTKLKTLLKNSATIPAIVIAIAGFGTSFFSVKWIAVNWLGMPHWYCVANAFVSSGIIFFMGRVAIKYRQFVPINDRIRQYMQSEGQTATDETFKVFRLVFITCSNVRIAEIICYFIGLYPLALLAHARNDYAISKCLKVYREQEALFKQKAYSKQDVEDLSDRKMEHYQNEMKSKFSKLDLPEEKRVELFSIIEK